MKKPLFAACVLIASSVFSVATVFAGAVRENPGFLTSQLAPNDDLSSGIVELGFSVNYAGGYESQLYVSNNGYVVLGQPGGEQFTSTNFTQKLFAAFFADVDTRGDGSGTAQWGSDTVDGHPAFAATWRRVGYFQNHADKVNSFQLVLIVRSDVNAGEFDVELNYDTINWDCGDTECGAGMGPSTALAGYSDGITNTLLPGAGVSGAFLDSNTTTGLVHGSKNSDVPGRYVYPFRYTSADGGQPVATEPSQRFVCAAVSDVSATATQPMTALGILIGAFALALRRLRVRRQAVA